MKTEILYEEVQGSGKRNTRVFFMITTVFFIISLIIQFLLGRENNEMILGLFTGFLLCAIISIFLNNRLITHIRTDGIYVRFPPFHPSFTRFLWKETNSWLFFFFR